MGIDKYVSTADMGTDEVGMKQQVPTADVAVDKYLSILLMWYS